MLKGHSRKIGACTSDQSGRRLVSVGWDCHMKIWNGQTGKFEGDLKTDQ